VVGIGPGAPDDRTHRAEKAIADSQVIVGYTPYLDAIADLIDGRETFASGMRQEVERCHRALERAAAGQTVSLISSGDPGIYGMAGLAIELAAAEGYSVPIEIVPGVTAASAAAAALGAPLMLDFAVLSLSDLLVPWDLIRNRLEAIAATNLALALYNPRSKRRVRQLEEVVEIFQRHRPGNTPVGVVTAASCSEQSLVITDLDHLLAQEVNMRSLVIVGGSMAKVLDGWLVTSRGYRL
jgi:precorrin-3B C17-methyltransferase